MAFKPEPAGNLNKRIAFEAVIGNRDARGGKQPIYGSVYSCWAKCRPIAPSEFLKRLGGQAMQTWAERAVEFVIRYVPGDRVNHKCRIRMNGRTFNIVGIIDPEERHVNLVITAYEVL